MQNFIRLLVTILVSFVSPLAVAVELFPVANGETTIEITKPSDGANVNLRFPFTLSYNITIAEDDDSGSDRAYVYVDDKKLQVLTHMQGDYTFDILPLGKHEICIKMANKSRQLTGSQKCINVTLKNLGGLY